MLPRAICLMLSAVGILFLAACDKTTLEHSWADPDVVNYQWDKPLALAIFDNDELRKQDIVQ